MLLSANSTAQFFIQNEYHHVEIRDKSLVLASTSSEEHIPFSIWNGKVKVMRGLFWGSLQFFAHEDGEVQRSWLVQGLPWQECRAFAAQLVTLYQQWHNQQCQHLAEYVPQWEEQLHLLEHLPAFLPHSRVTEWVASVSEQLDHMDITLEEAQQRLPERVGRLLPWLTDSSRTLSERNAQWMLLELPNWEVLFNQIESSPLNHSQQKAVLLNDDHNLVLAGAGSGKTSVLTARVAYLLQSHQVNSEALLLLAFGRDAAQEMRARLSEKIGMAADGASVNTFHQLGLKIIRSVEGQNVELSPIAMDDKLRSAWCIDWLKRHWMTPTNFKRWQKHLNQWPIAYLAGDEELGSHVENPKLIAWLEAQVSQLALTGLSKKQLQEKLVDSPDYSRLNSELALCWPCYSAWQKLLKEQQQIDFPTMITRATQYVESGKFVSPWRYIMVDEYQDISPDRLALIEALCEQNAKQQGATLFAVGDDWQAIYQFAGADVDLTTGFKQRFAHSTVHHLDTTYRFNNMIGEVANRFVQQNPEQFKKTLNSRKQQKQKAVTIAPTQHVEKILDDLNRKAKSPKSVLILGRNHYHKPNLLGDWQKLFGSLSIEFMTCHASKGREADYVIMVNVDEGQFPAKLKKRHLNNVLTQSKDSYPNAEERRLFYVALTRAKEKVWVTHTGAGSAFVKELLNDDYPVVKQGS